MLEAPPIRITKDIVYRKEISIAGASELLVGEGEFVYPQTPLMRVPVPQPSVSIPLARIIGVRPKDLAKFLLKRTGDIVQAEEVIARRKARIFSPIRECLAPISGEVEFIDYDKGEMVLSQATGTNVIPARAFGRIAKIEKRDKITIELFATVIDCIWGRGPGVVGRIRIITPDNTGEIERDKMPGTMNENILVGGVLTKDDVLFYAQRLGAKGLIVGGAPAAGHETFPDPTIRLPLTMAITEGFGAPCMSSQAFSCLQAYEGNEAWLNPLPSGRAEIVINQGEEGEPNKSPQPGLTIGSLVRVTSAPYFTQMATVVAIPAQKDMTEWEAVTEIVVVRLHSGSEVKIPRANVELLIA